ncbi:MAG: thrombospondin type 3 repeat-containing protein [Patescibacteria group bacterium]
MEEQNNKLKLPVEAQSRRQRVGTPTGTPTVPSGNASEKDGIILFGLVLFSISILITGYFKIKSAIYKPFAVKTNVSVEQLKYILKSQQDKDTDNDGITDWQEENLYGTSKYLADSDGDGFTDKAEIEAKSHPLDPASTPNNVDSYFPDNTAVQPIDLNIPRSEQNIDNLTPDQIREILITQGGMSKDEVDNIDDETLKKMYNETKQETGIDLESVLKNSPASPQNALSLSASEIRKLLLQSGADQETLDAIDDETLKKMFLENISNSN